MILVREPDAISVSVPAMLGCFSAGRTRDEALVNVRDAIRGWVESESRLGRLPLAETPAALGLLQKGEQFGKLVVTV